MTEDPGYSKNATQVGCRHDVPSFTTGDGMNNIIQSVETLEAKTLAYAVPQFPNQTSSPAIVRKKCLACNTDDLKPEYKYCPNCGRFFS